MASPVGVNSTTWTKSPATASQPHRNRNVARLPSRPPTADTRIPSGIDHSMNIEGLARSRRLARALEGLAELRDVPFEMADDQTLRDHRDGQVAARHVPAQRRRVFLIQGSKPPGDPSRLDVDSAKQAPGPESHDPG